MGSQVPTLQKLTSAQKNTLAQDVWQAPPRPGRQPRPRLRGGGSLCGEEADYSQLCHFPLFRRFEGAVSRTLPGIDLGTVFTVVLILIALDFVGTIFLAMTVGVAGKRSYEDDSWSSWLGLSSMTGVMRNMYNSLDIVETGFRYMDIEDESCRLKTICELESYAVSHPLASLAINTINSNLRGLERYQTAIQAGINGEDCALIYDQCRVSYVGY